MTEILRTTESVFNILSPVQHRARCNPLKFMFDINTTMKYIEDATGVGEG